jgi:Tol biopolymer transport system component
MVIVAAESNASTDLSSEQMAMAGDFRSMRQCTTMRTFSRLGLLLGVSLAPLAILVSTGCVGDSSTNGQDAAPDVATTDAAVDAVDAIVDAPAEAAPPCDTSKPWGAPVQLTELPSPEAFVNDLSHDELSLIFGRNAPDGGVGASDMYTATRNTTSEPFGNVKLLPALNSTADDGSAVLFRDKKTLVFSSSRSAGFDIWLATRSSAAVDFSSASMIASVSSGGTEADLALSPDETELWFSSDRGSSGMQLYVSAINGGSYGAASAVAGLHATGAEERNPLLSPDGLTLYFSRRVKKDGGSIDDYEMFSAKRASPSDAFGTPTPVAELNSAGWEAAEWISDDGCRLYLTRRISQPYSAKSYVASRPVK